MVEATWQKLGYCLNICGLNCVYRPPVPSRLQACILNRLGYRLCLVALFGGQQFHETSFWKVWVYRKPSELAHRVSEVKTNACREWPHRGPDSFLSVVTDSHHHLMKEERWTGLTQWVQPIVKKTKHLMIVESHSTLSFKNRKDLGWLLKDLCTWLPVSSVIGSRREECWVLEGVNWPM